MKVLIKYELIIDPAETWSQLDMFEADFAKFFSERGLDLEVVDKGEDKKWCKMLIVTKKPPEELMQMPEKTIKQTKRQLTAKRDVMGKYQK